MADNTVAYCFVYIIELAQYLQWHKLQNIIKTYGGEKVVKKLFQSILNKSVAVLVSVVLISQAMPFYAYAIPEESVASEQSSEDSSDVSIISEDDKPVENAGETSDSENEETSDTENSEVSEESNEESSEEPLEESEPQKEEKQYKILFEYEDIYKNALEIKVGETVTNELIVSDSIIGTDQAKVPVSFKLKTDDWKYSYKLIKVAACNDLENQKYTKIIPDANIKDLTASAEGTKITITQRLIDMADEKDIVHIKVFMERKVKKYKLQFTRNAENTSTIKIGGKDVDTNEIIVSADSKVNFYIESKDNESQNKYYRLASVTSNKNILLDKDVIGYKVKYNTTLQINEELVKGAKWVESEGMNIITIRVNVMRVYVIRVQYNANEGSIAFNDNEHYYFNSSFNSQNPEKAAGRVVVGKDTKQKFTAEAAETFRVSEIVVTPVENGKVVKKTYKNNESIVTYEVPNANKSYNISVVFAPMVFSVDVEIVGEKDGCEVTFPDTLEYGQNADITIKDKDGYFISNINIDGEEMELPEREENESISFNTGSVTKDKKIVIKVIKNDIIDENDYQIDLSGCIEDYGNGKYLFAWNNNPPVFRNTSKNTDKIEQKGIMLYYKGGLVSGSKNNLECKLVRYANLNKISVDEIRLYSKQANKSVVNSIKLDTPIEISYYEKTEAAVKLPSLPSANEKCKVYNSDIDIPVYFNIPTERYPTITSLRYKFTGEEYQELDISSITDSEELAGYNKMCFIHVPAEKYNRDNMNIDIMIGNSDGNQTSLRTDTFSINSERPTVSIVMEDIQTSEFSNESYFRFDRKAVIIIKDKPYTAISDRDYIADSLKIEYKAFDEEEYIVLGLKEKKQFITSLQENEGEIIFELLFDKEGSYAWEFNYTNAADLNNDNDDVSKNPNSDFIFTIDKTAPVGIFYLNGGQFDTKSDEYDPHFQYFYKTSAVIQMSSSDNNGIREVSTYKRIIDDLDATTVSKLTFDELEELYQAEESKFEKGTDIVSIDYNEKAVVYARIIDLAGNVVYMGTDGLIVDNAVPKLVEFTAYDINDNALNIPVDSENPVNIIDDIQNNKIKFTVKVNDAIFENAAYSGIKSVYYVVEKDGERIKDKNGIELHSLFKWDETSEKLQKSIVDEPLTFEIDPFLNANYNCDDIVVRILIKDNSENIYNNSDSYIRLSINIDVPEYTIKYSNSVQENAHEGYYVSREATITVSNDRSTSFDAEAFETAVRNAVSADQLMKMSGVVTEDKSDLIYFGEWKQNEENGSQHTVKMYFNYYGNYYFSDIIYSNKAHNSILNAENYTESFTIDKFTPTGEVKIGNNTWDKILNVLTFGLYSSNNYEITIDSSDKISPVETEYFISDSDKILTTEELANVKWQGYNKTINVNRTNYKFAVYARITDYAGNRKYLSSAGHIIDTNAPSITLTPEKAVKKLKDINVYNQKYKNGIKIDVKVSDSVDVDRAYSGIRHIEYWVENKEKADEPIVLYDWKFIKSEEEKAKTSNIGFIHGTIEIYDNGQYKTIEDSSLRYSQLIKDWSGTITIDPVKYNSSDIVVKVRAVDNTDIETIQSVALDIDITAPTISVSYDNNNDNNGNTYFKSSRIAVVTIKERSSHFDSSQATKGIVINATDVSGKKVANTFKISNWTTQAQTNADETIHQAAITYSGDANYTFEINYTDMAENKNIAVSTGSSVAPYKFTVDKNKPTGTVKAVSSEGRSDEWSGLRGDLLFNFWSNRYITVTETHNDATSPIEYVQYYKNVSHNAYDATNALTENDLSKITAWQNMSTLRLTPNEQCAVYIRLIDKAGNITYMGTNELIVDDKAPVEKMRPPEIKITPEQTASGIYSGDVKVDIDVEDQTFGGTYSGIRVVSYRVLNMGNVTASGTLYQFGNINPSKQSQLQQKWSGNIIVNSKNNNSNNVVVEVTAVDNAGNSSTENIVLKIDVTEPSVSVSYDNNSSIGELYNNARTATITVRERNFRADYVDVVLNGKRMSLDELKWSDIAGSGNGDNNEHTARISFIQDNDYTLAIQCKDEAANKNQTIDFGNSTNWNKFTVDRTKPVIIFDFTKSNVLNSENYSQEKLTAKVVIDELHFNASKVKFTKLVDSASEPLTDLSWNKENGNNRHYVNIPFDKDAHYLFSVAYTDEAGNSGDGRQKNFCVDTKDPELDFSINGSSERQAVSGKIETDIVYGDTNFDDNSVDISITGNFVNGSKGNVSNDIITFELSSEKENKIDWTGSVEQNNGDGKKTYKLTMNDFPTGEDTKDDMYKEFDDIYTISISVKDKAGHQTSKSATFSINRYGSTYDISQVQDIIGTYIKTPVDVVVTEVNPDILTSHKVRLYKNSDRNSDTELKEGEEEDYEFTEKYIGESKANSLLSKDDAQWHEYTYKIFSSNFTDDGDYEIELESVDRANNISKNNLDTKQRSIFFHVDNNDPVVNVSNLSSYETYAEESISIKMSANDGGLLDLLEVYLDDETTPFKVWNAEEIKKIQSGENEESRLFTFDIAGNTTSSHMLKVVAYDAAGNRTEEKIEGFYVTTDLMTRFVNNKPLFYGTITGLILLVGAIVFLIVRNVRKKRT